MKTRIALLALGLAAAPCLLWPGLALAQRELVAPPPAHRIELKSWLNNLEPAAGGAEKPKDTHENKGHNTPKKSAKGRDANALPPLPTVKIGGITVTRQIEIIRAREEGSIPTELQRRDFSPVLAKRFSFTPFAHNPQMGPNTAPITVVVFEDLACISCTAASQEVNQALADVLTPAEEPISTTTPISDSLAGVTRVVWVHSTSSRFQPNNLPAFYSKVAGQYGKFWEFRNALLAAPDREPATLFALLTGLNIEPRIIRQVMLTEARRYYRELDGDVLQGHNFGTGNPPLVLVNGIRVGQSGIPLKYLPDVLTYVHNRHKAGLNEPPV